MKGETGYLLPYGCAHAPMTYKWNFGGLLLLLFSINKYYKIFLLLILPILLNVLSRLYFNNYKLNSVVIIPSKRILEPKPVTELVFPNIC